MTNFLERIHIVEEVARVAQGEYLTPEDRVSIARLNEIYESYKADIDPDFQGLSPTAFGKAARDVPEGVEAEEKLWNAINALLMSGKFGQVDWRL